MVILKFSTKVWSVNLHFLVQETIESNCLFYCKYLTVSFPKIIIFYLEKTDESLAVKEKDKRPKNKIKKTKCILLREIRSKMKCLARNKFDRNKGYKSMPLLLKLTFYQECLN